MGGQTEETGHFSTGEPQLRRRNLQRTKLVLHTQGIMAKSDGAEQVVDGNIQEGATYCERKENGSGPTNGPNAGSLGARARW